MARHDGTAASVGFAPISGDGARILILGSLPGVASLDAVEYYAHPQNAFWKIMHRLFAVEGDYATRCRQLIDQRIAVWDVLASSVRPGSLDSSIQLSTAAPNDFAKFLSDQPDIQRIGFNGKTAERLFRRRVVPTLGLPLPELVGLPSTSPAHASMSFDRKLEIWRSMLVRETRLH